MIGVISKPEEREVVEEFFQLFKTPWELYDPSRHYDVVIATVEDLPEVSAPLFLVFGTGKCGLDTGKPVETRMQGPDMFIGMGEDSLPIYGKVITFENSGQPILFCSKSGQTVGYEMRGKGQRTLRIGYDLFEEVRFLLTEGQPPRNAMIPTLDLHVAMLRSWIVGAGISLTEIPPVPEGYNFVACLTHDIDFIGIRNHFLDHSMFGFLYRGTVGTLFGFVRGKVRPRNLWRNLRAASSLPLVYLGVCKDPWCQFDRCLEIEGDARSTFFFIPFKNRSGEGFHKGRAKRRAAKYDVGDAGAIIQRLHGRGCEIGVHGIDAWHNVDRGRLELKRIRENTPSQDGIGIRMHWLSRNDRSFDVLDEAGYSYDSTYGYNETVGFKAGTAQAFRPIGVRTLLEVPLEIQDTALFGRGRMNASTGHADDLCRQVIDHVNLHGGVLTVLWHQRSMGPERLWDGFYAELVRKIKASNGWFATANEVARWFRMRRSVSFETTGVGTVEVRLDRSAECEKSLPRLVVRSYGRGRSLRVFETSALGCPPEN